MEGNSRRRGGTTPRHKNTSEDEVERMLEAAQDELLLKLSLDSHIAHLSQDQLLPSDLDRRFQALKSQRLPPPPPSDLPPSKITTLAPKSVQDDGDLLARFDALKAASSSSSSALLNNEGDVGPTKFDEGNDDEDEVEKIIGWAKDAARLDPSPPSDDDDVDDDDDDDHDVSGDDDDEEVRRPSKGAPKSVKKI